MSKIDLKAEEKWFMLNAMLNAVRKAKGFKTVPHYLNPYSKKEEEVTNETR